MFFVKLSSGFFSKSRHLQFVNFESACKNGVDNFAHRVVRIWFNHGEGSLTICFKTGTGVYITIVRYFQDSSTDSNLASQEKVIKLNVWDLTLLEEHAGILDVEHLQGFGDWVVEQSVLADNASLWVLPINFKSKLFFS